MKYILTPIFILSLCSVAFSQLKFHEGDLTSAFEKAAEADKHLIVDCYTDWCGWCKWMDKNTFTDEEVIDYYNENFIVYKLDGDSDEGESFTESYSVTGYPTFLVFEPNKTYAHQQAGSMDADEFIEFGKDAQDFEEKLAAWKNKFNNDEAKDAQFYLDYAKKLDKAGLSTEDLEHTFFEVLQEEKGEDAFVSALSWDYLSNFVYSHESHYFGQMLELIQPFKEIVDEEEMDTYLKSVMTNACYKLKKTDDEKKLNAVLSLSALAFEENHHYYDAKAMYYFYSTDEAQAHDYAKKYLTNHCTEWQELNEAAWRYYENEDDRSKLKIALNWAAKSVELNEHYYNIDTYAHLFYKMGEYNDAKNWAQTAIELAVVEGHDFKMTEELYHKAQDKISGK